jgi:hypothetical protein
LSLRETVSIAKPACREVIGTKPAIWVDVNPPRVDTLYRSEPPAVAGAVPTKISFNREPAKYVEPRGIRWEIAARSFMQADVPAQ